MALLQDLYILQESTTDSSTIPLLMNTISSYIANGKILSYGGRDVSSFYFQMENAEYNDAFNWIFVNAYSGGIQFAYKLAFTTAQYRTDFMTLLGLS